jgi:hypothetical protein
VDLSLRAKIKRRLVRTAAELALQFQTLMTSKADTARQMDSLRGLISSLRPVATEYELIRLGSDGDGGYLVPDDLTGVATCFSPGVSTTADFEIALAQRNICCFLADYSVAAAPAVSPLIKFEKKFLGDRNDSIHITLSEWVHTNSPSGDNDLILQMDIEGDEYPVLIDTPLEVLGRFRILVIEFHFLDALFSPPGFRLISSIFRKLLPIFTVVHIHPNNYCKPVRHGAMEIPPVMEFTFLRSDRISTPMPARRFPHPLDRANNRYESDLALPGCWYQQ